MQEKLEEDYHRVQLENVRLETELKQKTEMLQRVHAGSQKVGVIWSSVLFIERNKPIIRRALKV